MSATKRFPAPQAGITNRPPDHLLLQALMAVGEPAAVRSALERLRELVHHELRSMLDETTPTSDKNLPSAETGELGFEARYDRYHLTVTVAFGLGLFDKLGTAPEQRPQDLIAIPWDGLGDAPDVRDNGDLLLQVCSDSAYIAEHVLRRVGEELGDALTPVWTVAGVERHTSRAGRTSREEGRALIGFKDGTSNLNPRHEPDDAALVFVDPDAVGSYPPAQPAVEVGMPSPYGGGPVLPNFPADLRPPPAHEPDWVEGGTYMVARASTIDMQTWDKRTLTDQEHSVGRWKVSGAPLHATDDPHAPMVEPDFTGDPDGATTPLNSHVRKTGPRGAGDEHRRIFRRGYPLLAAPGPGGLVRGLVFICFGRTISTQFEFITRAWTNNPDFPRPGAQVDMLRSIEHVLCGGYFFVPALEKPSQPWSFRLPPE